MRVVFSFLCFALMLYALNESFDKQKVREFQNWLVNLWVEIADDNFHDSFHHINGYIYGTCVKIRARLRSALATILICSAISVPIIGYMEVSHPTDTILERAIESNRSKLEIELEMHSYRISGNDEYACTINAHYTDWDQKVLRLISNAAGLKDAVTEFSEANTTLVKLALPMAVFLAAITYFPLLIVVFSISTRVTLKIMRTHGSGNMQIILFSMVSLLVALLIPATILSVIGVAISFMLHLFGHSLISELDHSDINFATIVLFEYNFQISYMLFIFDIPSIYLYAATHGGATISTVQAFFSNFYELLISLFASLFATIQRIRAMDFRSHYVVTMLNWTIFLDMLFSFAYFLPSTIIVGLARHPAFRNSTANLLQYCAEHPQGPLVAIAIVVVSVANLFLPK